MRGLIFYVLFFIYFIGAVAAFLAQTSHTYGWGFVWLESNVSIFSTIQISFSSVILGIGGIFLGWAFLNDGILKYKLSEISGMIGVVIALLSFGLMLFWPVFTWLMFLAGTLCLYAVVSPAANAIYKNIKCSRWEAGGLTALFSFLFLFFTGWLSNVIINDVFEVDPKHFPLTKVVAVVVVLSPLLFVISSFALLFFIYKLIKGKDEGSFNLFLSFNGVIAFISVFIFSFTMSLGGKTVIRNAASLLDFNAKSICSNVSEGEGVIYLDNKYELVLVDKEEGTKHIYNIIKCNNGA